MGKDICDDRVYRGAAKVANSMCIQHGRFWRMAAELDVPNISLRQTKQKFRAWVRGLAAW